MPRLRIVHYLPEILWSHGGVVRAVLDLCGLLAARGHDVTLLTCDATDVPDEWDGFAVNTPKVKSLGKRNRMGLLTRESLRSADEYLHTADVLHLHGPWITSNVQLARRSAAPYAVTLHGMLDDWSMDQRNLKKRIYLAVAGRSFLERALLIHCTAAAELEQARKWFTNDRAVILPLLFDCQPLRALPGPGPAHTQFPVLNIDRPKILYLSRLHPKKGLELLIEAMAVLNQRDLAAQLFVVGDGDPDYERSIRLRVAELGLQEQVHFLGLVKGAMKFSIYQAVNIFVLPTSQENFGLVFPESLGCGTPIVTTRGVDIWQELQAAGGLIVERTADSIATAAERLLLDAPLRDELSKRGREWVMTTFDSDTTCQLYEQAYKKCQSPRSPAQGV